MTRIFLQGGSLKGVLALMQAQGAKRDGAAVWREGQWRVPVILPVSDPEKVAVFINGQKIEPFDRDSFTFEGGG